MSLYQEQRLLAFYRDGGRCLVCGGPGEQTHHRQGRGGAAPHRLPNLLTVCADCHRRIHGSPAWAYEQGYMVRRLGRDTPERTPIVVHGLPKWLAEDGTTYPQKEQQYAE